MTLICWHDLQVMKRPFVFLPPDLYARGMRINEEQHCHQSGEEAMSCSEQDPEARRARRKRVRECRDLLLHHFAHFLAFSLGIAVLVRMIDGVRRAKT
jgi:hypothetical protein